MISRSHLPDLLVSHLPSYLLIFNPPSHLFYSRSSHNLSLVFSFPGSFISYVPRLITRFTGCYYFWTITWRFLHTHLFCTLIVMVILTGVLCTCIVPLIAPFADLSFTLYTLTRLRFLTFTAFVTYLSTSTPTMTTLPVRVCNMQPVRPNRHWTSLGSHYSIIPSISPISPSASMQ